MNNYPVTKDPQADFCMALKRGESIENLQSQFPTADMNLPSNGMVPLAWAIGSGKIENVAWLLERSAEINAPNPGHKKMTALFHLDVSKAIFQLLIKGGADLDARDMEGNTCLHFCSEELVDDCVQGLNVDVTNADGDTPLHLAYREKNWKKAYQLLECGANESLENKQGITPLEFKLLSAVKEFDSDKVKEVVMSPLLIGKLRKKAVREALFKLSKSDCLEFESVRAILQLLIKSGADLDARDLDGKTCLHYCSAALVVDFMQGINVDEMDADGNTPLHIAYFYKNWVKAYKLIECGADERLTNNQGITPLELKLISAANALDGDKVKEALMNPFLAGELREKVLVNALFKLGDYYCLEEEERQKRVTILQLFIEAGVDLNFEKEIGLSCKRRTFLCQAIKDGWYDLEFIKKLLDAGAHVGKIKLLNACIYSRDYVPLLLERGARLSEDEKREFPILFRYGANESMLNSIILLIKAGANFTYSVYANLVENRHNSVRDYRYYDHIIATLDLIPEPVYDVETGQSMLHCSIGHEKLLQYLMHRWSISINAKDNKGQTPLFYAREIAHINYLLRHGADSSIRNLEGRKIGDYLKRDENCHDVLTDRKNDFNLLFRIVNVKRQKHDAKSSKLEQDSTAQLFQLFFSLPPDLQKFIIGIMIMAPVMNRQSKEYCGASPVHAGRVYSKLVGRAMWYTPMEAQSNTMITLGRNFFNNLRSPNAFSQDKEVIAFVKQTAILQVDEKFAERFTSDKKEYPVLIEGFIRCLYNEYHQTELSNLFILVEKIYFNDQRRAIIAIAIFDKLSADPKPKFPPETINYWLQSAKELDHKVFKIFYTEKKAKEALEKNLRSERRYHIDMQSPALK